ncbi:hypothetical protein ACJX0J_019647, partial [Zea mays]
MLAQLIIFFIFVFTDITQFACHRHEVCDILRLIRMIVQWTGHFRNGSLYDQFMFCALFNHSVFTLDKDGII